LEKYWTGSRVKPNAKKELSNNYQFLNDKLQKADLEKILSDIKKQPTLLESKLEQDLEKDNI